MNPCYIALACLVFSSGFAFAVFIASLPRGKEQDRFMDEHIRKSETEQDTTQC